MNEGLRTSYPTHRTTSPLRWVEEVFGDSLEDDGTEGEQLWKGIRSMKDKDSIRESRE